MTELSLLHVTELAQTAVRPRCGALHVSLTALNLFSGRAALTKSEELRQLDTALAGRGLPDALSLEGASLDVDTGLFSRSSTVTYRAVVRVTDLELLPAALEVVSEAKQATLSFLSWEYPTSAPDELVAACAAAAAAKARTLARALGVTLGGLHEARTETDAPPAGPQVVHLGGRYGVMKARTSSVTSELAGLDVGPTRQLGVRVSLAFATAASSR